MANTHNTDYEQARRVILPNRPRKLHGWALFIGDALAIIIAWFIASQAFLRIPIYTLFIEYGGQRIGVVEILSFEQMAALAAVLLLFRHIGHYRDHSHYFFQLRSIVTICAAGLVIESILRLWAARPTSLLALAIAWGLYLAFILLFRVVSSNLITAKKPFRQPVIVLSRTDLGRQTIDAIERKPRLGYRVAGSSVADASAEWQEIAKAAIEQGDDEALENLKVLAQQADPNVLFLYAFDVFNQDTVASAIAVMKTIDRPFGFITSGTGIRIPEFKEFPFFGEDILLLLPDQRNRSLTARFVKRTFDIIVSALMIVLLAPLFLICSFSIRKDGGPAFFAHSRIGKDGRPFDCLKFRTMIVNADQALQEHLEENRAARTEWEETQKLKDDPRVTAMGNFLRKTSLDELPQLLNVLKGEMSFVGPRPIVRGEIEKYGFEYKYYREVRPGITGLWQVSGRNNTSYEERVELDKWYVNNVSIWLDLFILLKTVPDILLRKGAY